MFSVKNNLVVKQTIMLRSVPQMLKKWRIAINRILKVRQTTCNWIKKILDEATWMFNVFLILWFFYLFLLCSISLLVKYDFILWYVRYEAWVNAIRASSFIENVPQISANWPQKFPQNSREIGFFFLRICCWKCHEIWLFFRDLPEDLISP